MSDTSSTPAPAPAKAVAKERAKDVCVNCGAVAVVCSDGISAARRCWCQAHKPANLPVR